MKMVRIQVGNLEGTFLQIRNICFPKEDCPIKIINAWDDESEYFPSTLKDISIIMRQMVGQGVTWQLANELSNRLNIHDPYIVLNILHEIFEEYGNLSEEDAFNKYEKSPKLIDEKKCKEELLCNDCDPIDSPSCNKCIGS